MTKLHKLPEFPLIHCSQRNDIVEQLLEIIHIHQLNGKILKDENERLKGVIAELQHAPQKPKIKPSTVEKPNSESKERRQRDRPKGSKKDRISIHRELIVKPEKVPLGATFKGYRSYLVQDIEIKPFNTLLKIERWKTFEGNYIKGVFPKEYQGSHFH